MRSSLVKWQKPTTWLIQLAGQSITLRPSQSLFQKRLDWHAENENRDGSLTEDKIEVSAESLQGSADTETHLIPVTRIKIEVGMNFRKSLKHLVSVAGWTYFVHDKNGSDWRQLCKVSLNQVGETILRIALKERVICLSHIHTHTYLLTYLIHTNTLMHAHTNTHTICIYTHEVTLTHTPGVVKTYQTTKTLDDQDKFECGCACVVVRVCTWFCMAIACMVSSGCTFKNHHITTLC